MPPCPLGSAIRSTSSRRRDARPSLRDSILAEHCAAKGVDIAQLALQFCLRNPDITTTIAGSANPDNIRKWVQWADEPLDEELLAEVLEIFRPVKNIGHKEGLDENN